MEENFSTLKRLILDKTEGTPFFMEEVVQTLAEEGVLSGERGHYRLEKAPTELHISPTVQGVLTARIDRLSPTEKAFLHQLAVIGRQFPLSLVLHVVTQPEEELYRLLSSLQRKEFLYEQPAFPEPNYIFKHALTQEVAYGTVLQERRKALHERTAQAIESLYSTKLEDHYSELAHHYTRSGNTPKAVEYLHRAGQQAEQRSAYVEAISHLTTALELLKTLPDTPERARQELTLQLALGAPLQATKGYVAQEVGNTYTRARELCQQIGETPQLFPVLWGLWYFYVGRAEYQTARELGEQCLALAHREQDSALLVEAHFALGLTLRCLGELTLTREQLEQGIALYDPLQHRSLAFLYTQDPKVTSLCNAAWALWDLGYPDQALKRIHDALTLAQELSHPFSLAYALFFVAMLHQYRREGQLAQELAEATVTLCTEQGFSLWLVYATILRGWALAAQEQGEQGIAQLRQGLTAVRATVAELGRSHHLALLAEAYGKVGRVEEGLSALAEALEVVDRTGERFYEAELYRLKGELSLQSAVHSRQSTVTDPQSPTPNTQHPTPSTQAEVEREAEACFLKAIEIARKQQAKSLELRAVTSLARLWQQQGKREDARQMLAEIYHWFTEGFDTKDLQEAKALLEELS
jgi:predicted ATPase